MAGSKAKSSVKEKSVNEQADVRQAIDEASMKATEDADKVQDQVVAGTGSLEPNEGTATNGAVVTKSIMDPTMKDVFFKVRFTSFPTDSSIKGICSVTLNDAFCIKGVKVIEGSNGLFMALPSYKSGEEYKDVCHPVTAEGRKNLSGAVLKAFAVQQAEHEGNVFAAGMEGNAKGQAAPEGVPMGTTNGIA